MISLYIFDKVSRASVYGIGTYIRELTAALINSTISIYLVHLRTDKANEGLEESDDVRHLYIPPPIIPQPAFDTKKQFELYYKNAVYLLKLKIKEEGKLIFHFVKYCCHFPKAG